EVLPEDITVACGEVPEASLLTVTDNCDTNASVAFEEKTTFDGCATTLERIWTATDCAGNSTMHTQIITIEDKQAPSFVEALPEDLTLACGQNTLQAMELTAIDNCNGNVNVQFEEKLTTQGCTTTLERTWTASDCAGNTSIHKQYITQNQDQIGRASCRERE